MVLFSDIKFDDVLYWYNRNASWTLKCYGIHKCVYYMTTIVYQIVFYFYWNQIKSITELIHTNAKMISSKPVIVKQIFFRLTN